ncbi:MAG: glycoside hydrolase family 95 protein [Bacteroidales bacterium]|nr:glycoside hydrolase family 95 protein [Bacteroidales bacterium]
MKKQLFFILALFVVIQAFPVNDIMPDNTLWYQSPANEWKSQCLHLGNGYMGASFYGGIENERFDIAEKTFWAGGPNVGKEYNFGIIEGGKEYIPKIRKLILENKFAEADSLCWAHMLGDYSNYGYFSKVGSLLFHFKNQTGEATDYVRLLDLNNALGKVRYNLNGTEYSREYFCSYPDKVMVCKFSSNQKGKISFDVEQDLTYKPDEMVFDGKELTVKGIITCNGLDYCIRIALRNQGGTVCYADGKLSVNDADQATLIYSIDTEYKNDYKSDYKGVNPVATTQKNISNALSKGYEQLKQTHVSDYKNLYDRAQLTLVGNSETEKLPTDKRFELLKKGTTDDSALKALYFNLGRYLLISASRPGTLPSTLQGVWNSMEWAPWSGNFQSNINLQEMYWSCGPTNLPECQEGYIEWIESLVYPGRKVASSYYGTKGWVSHATGNIWGHAAPGSDIKWGLYPSGAAWHCHHLWSQFEYTRDMEYLKKRAYPIMKEAAEFWLENLVEKDGNLIIAPSVSAEHGIQIADGKAVKYSTIHGESNENKIFTVPCFQDIEMVYDLFSNVLEAAQTLKTDKGFQKKILEAQKKLPALKIGKYGQLQEWMYDYDNPRDHHRHIAHLYALYPGRMISPEKTPQLAEAARTSLNMRDEGFIRDGWYYTGGNWSMAWRAVCWARLLDGDRAIKVFNLMNKENGYENLMNSQVDEMQVDASMATPGIFAEMLLQSHDGCIHLLPALPTEWPEGKIKGFKTKDGYIIDMEWEYGQLKKAEIKLPQDATLPPLFAKGKQIAKSDNRISVVRGN